MRFVKIKILSDLSEIVLKEFYHNNNIVVFAKLDSIKGSNSGKLSKVVKLN